MKKIRVKFVGFWQDFDAKDNFIINSLKRSFDVELSEQPEYLFSSCFSDEYLEYDCVRIFYTGENLCPDFNAFDYGIGYEYMNFGDRYLRFPNYLIDEIYGRDAALMIDKHNFCSKAEKRADKTGFCAFVVSKGNGYVDDMREKFFYALSKYKTVDSGGRFLNNIGQPEGVEDKLEFQSKYKFAIAFENVSHSGYSTEKIVQAFAAGTVPVYWGDPDIGKQFNEKAFVNCHRFENIQKMVEYIRKIDQNDNLYLEMLREPALNDENFIQTEQTKLEEFLYHICSQEYQSAFRRDRVGYGQMHCDKLREIRRLRKKSMYRKIKKWIMNRKDK